jgi:glucose dehydrogenase
VSAYDLASGKLAWRFYTVPGDPAKGPDESPAVTVARKTWSQDSRWDLGGGTAWDSMVYDLTLNLLYVGVGNGMPHPVWSRSPGGGDNLYLSSIVALDAATGVSQRESERGRAPVDSLFAPAARSGRPSFGADDETCVILTLRSATG